MAVSVADRDGIRWITLDRPAKLNALTRDDLRDAREAVHTAPGSAIVVTGAGERAFGAGMHVESFVGLDRDQARDLIGEVRDLVGAVRCSPLVTAAAVNGYCLGAALELALACDLRVAAEHAMFGMPEIHVGIPSVIDAALLQQYVGLAKAKEMLLVGDPVPVADVPGLVNAVVPLSELRTATEGLVRRAARHSPVAVAAQKRLFEVWQNAPLTEAIERSVEEFADVFLDPRTAAAVEAHVQRVLRRRGG